MSVTTVIDLNADWDLLEVTEEISENSEEVERVGDALVKSLKRLAKVDIKYIADVSGKTPDEVVKLLKGSIYQNPDTWNGSAYEGWETADEYLSGNLLEKKKHAYIANVSHSHRFDDNIEALNKLIPESRVHFDEVKLDLGMSFIEPEIIDRFLDYLLGETPVIHGIPVFNERYNSIRDINGKYEIPRARKNIYKNSVTNTSTYGSKDKPAIEIIEDILNNRDSVVYHKRNTYSSSGKREVNKAATAVANENRRRIIEVFEEWVRKTPEIRATVENAYTNKYGCIRKRVFKGDFVEKQWGDVTLYDYQRNAIARLVLTRNGLIGLPVGSGKTFVIAISAAEILRMNLAKKIMITVPNGTFTQFKEAMYRVIPDTEIYFFDRKNFNPRNKKSTLEFIRDSESGIFVLPFSSFDGIPVSKTYYREEVIKQLSDVKQAIIFSRYTTAALKHKESDLKKKLLKLEGEFDDANTISFDKLGINMLYIDEFHSYKNINIDSSSYALGINKKGSPKCNRALDKMRIVQRDNGGRGVVGSTGTPITNSVTDIYYNMKALQNGELALHGLSSFDSFVNEFFQKSIEFEIDVDTTGYRLATRYSRFKNLGNLISMFSSMMEYHNPDMVDGVPECNGYIDIVVPKTDEFEAFLEEISARCEIVRNHNVPRKIDNMLKITVDGRMAALDLRLVNSDAEFTKESKVYYCAYKVAEIYKKTKSKRSTQLIFCDTSTPKDEFNIYDETKRILVELDVDESEIAYIHDADSDRKKEKLLAKVRGGEIRVLIGSTMKLGTGVNVQDKLIAIHHLDIPWRPADMTQREGRILRPGNENKEVFIYRYITEGSFDAYSYQLLETKAKIIAKIMNGDSDVDSESELIDDTVLSYAEIKSLAIGNPDIKARFEAANELARFKALRAKSEEKKISILKELDELPKIINRQYDLIFDCHKDVNYAREHPVDLGKNERRMINRIVFDGVRTKGIVSKEACIVKDCCGFRIIYPKFINSKQPYVWLERNGRYKVEIGDSERGVMMRIENVINSLPDKLENYRKSKDALVQRKEALEKELRNINYYSEEIEFYYELVKDYDRRLGVK